MSLLKILLYYIRDSILTISTYFFASVVLILFFNLTLKSTEWFYPIMLSILMGIPCFCYNFKEYYGLIRLAERSKQVMPAESIAGSLLYKEISSGFTCVGKNYQQQINEYQNSLKNFKRFISQFIHAMKTPVTIIELVGQRAQALVADEREIHQLFDDIAQENLRQMNMMDNVLSWLRVDEFDKDYIPEAVDLVRELNYIINSKKRSFIYNNLIPNIIKTSPQATVILTDTKWNRVMLEQIISNAIKYSNAGEHMKKIDFEIIQQTNNTLLTISDNGVGIPVYDMARITQPFFTGENGRKQKNATGIGLYIVELISKKLGHNISFKSQINQGTTVTISYLTKM